VTEEEFRAICAKVGITPERFAEIASQNPELLRDLMRGRPAGEVPVEVEALALFAEGLGQPKIRAELAEIIAQVGRSTR